MNEQLYKYFLGELSDTDKKELLNRIESNPEDKAEFIRIKNTITISNLGEQNGDNEWASRKKKELETRINRKQVRKLYINLAKYAAVVAILLVNIWLLTDKFIPQENSIGRHGYRSALADSYNTSVHFSSSLFLFWSVSFVFLRCISLSMSMEILLSVITA